MKKILSCLLLLLLCFTLRPFAAAEAPQRYEGSYEVNDKGSVEVDANIPPAREHKYYTDQVQSMETRTFQHRIPPYEFEYPMVRSDEFDSRYFAPVPPEHRGTVDKVNINGVDAYIHLPNGYAPDSDEQYNVLFLAVANGHRAISFMLADHRKEEFGVSSSLPYRQEDMPTLIYKDLYDAIGYYDNVRIIYVAMAGTNELTYQGMNQIAAIQKYVVDNYNTYAKSSSDDDLTDARYHFGIGGISGGGVLATLTGLRDYCDRFGYVATFDGSFNAEWDEENVNPRSVDLFYGSGPPGEHGQSSYHFFAEHYLRSFTVSHVYVEFLLGHDYLMGAQGVYHIVHNWFQE